MTSHRHAVLVLTLLATIGACTETNVFRASERPWAVGAGTADAVHLHEVPPVTLAISDYSLYDLDSEWWDQDGKARTLGSLAGRVQVLAMVYTNCGHSCPRILAEMKRLESALGDEYAGRVGFVLASLDTERDSPERLRQFADDLMLDTARWTMLGADAPAVLDLAAVLGIRYRRESPTEYSHTNLIVVLTHTGEIALRMGVGEGHAEAVAAIRRILE